MIDKKLLTFIFCFDIYFENKIFSNNYKSFDCKLESNFQMVHNLVGFKLF